MGDIPLDPQVIIILVVLVFGAIRWVIEQFRKTHLGDEDEGDEQRGPLSEFEDLYDEARREILERQGREYPDDEEIAKKLEEYSGRGEADAAVPPPVPPPLPGKRRPPPAPTITSFPSPLEQLDAGPVRQKLSTAEKAALERVKAGGLQTARSRRSGRRPQSRVRQLLATPAATRDAVVVREILGPAKSME